MRRTAEPDAAGGQPDTGGCLGGDTGELDELRFHWGYAYDIGADAGRFTARRRDGQAAPLADAEAEGLRLRIVADYERIPVPRDLP